MTDSRPLSKRLSLVIIILFLLSLLPLVLVGLHARPTWDDYAFSALSSFSPAGELDHYISRSVRYAAQNGNPLDIVRAVFRTVSDNYLEWQGTFSAIALFSIHPAVLFGANAYPLTMFMTLFALIAATLFLLKTIFQKNYLILGLIILACSIQWVPHIAQGFFWYNGAVYYTFFYSIMLFNVSLKIRLLRKSTTHLPLIFAISFLSFFIGGGNFVTALLGLLLNGLFFLFTLFQNRKQLTKAGKKYLPFCLFSLLSLTGLLLSMAAPGNAVRGDLFGTAFSFSHVFATIIASITLALSDIIAWTSPGILLLLFLSLPLLWQRVKDTTFTYPLPFLVLVASFLLLAAQNAPPLYAMNFGGDPKLRNIVFFSYLLLLFGNVFYMMGWLQKRKQLSLPPLKGKILVFPSCIALFLLPFALGLGFGGGVHMNLQQTPASFLTLRDLQQGNPQQFLAEHRARQQLLENTNDTIVTIPAFEAMPLTLLPFEPYCWESGLMIAELTHAPTHWTNRGLAAYYGVSAVIEAPPSRTLASFRNLTLHFQGNSLSVHAYSISDMWYFRLEDLYEILGDYLPLNRLEDTLHPLTNPPASTPWLQAAYLIGTEMLISDTPVNIPSFQINNSRFFRYDFLLWLDVSVSFQGADVYFNLQ